MTRTTRSLAAGLLALALGAAGCSQDGATVRAGAPEQSAPTPDADVPTATDAGRYARYVSHHSWLCSPHQQPCVMT